MIALTPREEEVAALVRLGYDVEQIADELGIGMWSVRDHVKMIRAKTGAASMRDIPRALGRTDEEE